MSSILVIGATGNTGEAVVRRLSDIFSSTSSPPFRIIALTRSTSSSSAQKLLKLPHVTVEENSWQSLSPSWLISHSVARVYIAPHNEPTQFVDETAFYIKCRAANVQYVVKLGTSPWFTSPDNAVYYGRAHWAVEQVLRSQEFAEALPSTVIQANFFIPYFLRPTIQHLQQHATGKPAPLLLKEDVAVALVDPADVGYLAATLLALPDPSAHYGQRYNISGANDTTGRDVGDALRVHFPDARLSFGDDTLFIQMLKEAKTPDYLMSSLESGWREFMWLGKASLKEAPTSDVVMHISPPSSSLQKALNIMMKDESSK